MRLEAGLKRAGHDPILQWFPHRYELMPWRLRHVDPPPNTDVIHANSWYASSFLRHPLPLVTTVHHLVHDPAFWPYRSPPQSLYHNYFIRPRELKAILNSNAVTTVSKFVRTTVMHFSGCNDVETIYNWIPDNDIRSLEDINVESPSTFNMLIIGAHSRRKGRDLLEPFVSLLDNDMTLRIVGSTQERFPNLRSNRIQFCGRLNQNQLFDEYSKCDIVLSLSRYEGFGYTLLEAGHFCKPVVAFDISAIPEVIVHMKTGILVPVDRVDLIAAASKRLKNDAALRKRLGQNANRFVKKSFQERSQVNRYIDIYRQLLE